MASDEQWSPFYGTPKRTLVLPGSGWRQRGRGEPIMDGDYIRYRNWFYRVRDGAWSGSTAGQDEKVIEVWTQSGPINTKVEQRGNFSLSSA